MRIASMQFQATMDRSLNINQGALAILTEKMATGNKLLVPSDDPITNVRISRLTREQATLDQYVDNIAAVKIRLSKNETYLDGMVGDMNSARDLLVWASDGANTPADLNSMVNSLTALRDSVYFNANTKDQEGRYIFSGTLTSTPAISYNAGNAPGSRYADIGNNGQQQVVVGNGITQVANVDALGVEDWLNKIDAAIDALGQPGADPNNAGTRGTLTAALDGTDTALSLVSGKIATFGGAQNVLETLSSNHSNVALSNKMAMTEMGQLDYGLAATQLNGYNTALQATYQAYSKIANLSLFNAL
ncbi:flagellar hook-associated protein FlgL [Pseudoduganella sp. RAF53_2]|uniref:flagellar hook-associated protein FlgL n=1 Tax=Pseudoduganella sp. RAF53_2 TaxID=3233060 RepID=UPI003F9A3BDC